ncbi:MAG: hypothetical protein KAT65_25255, partial [Methanophagales archaeon]|nr:hypothetical protein [Methanophagales archaeon]
MVENIVVLDTMRPRRTVKSAIATVGNVNISKKREIIWEIGDLYPDEVATLRIEGALDFAMDVGEEKRIDNGVSINFDGIKKFLPEEERRIIAETPSCEYIKNITYPVNATVGCKALIIWEVTANTTRTYVKYYPPDSEESEYTERLEGGPGKYGAAINLTMPGTWEFKIRYCNDSYCCYSPRYQINVSAQFPSINTTAFAHTEIPKLSLTSAQIAAARKAPVIDINKAPLEIIPIEEEESLKKAVLDYKIRPDYLIVVGGIRSVPFVDTGLVQDYNTTTVFDIYRDYDLQFDKDVFHEVSTGRIIGLDVYDTSALTARTIAYEKIAEKNGDWKSKALV